MVEIIFQEFILESMKDVSGGEGMIAVAIDGGGTKTETLVLDTEQRQLMKAHTAASNLNIVSDDELYKLLKEALTKLGVNRDLKQQVFCFAGFAGAGSTSNQRRVKHVLENILPAGSVISIEPDAINGLLAGTIFTATPGVGIVQISGTGSITFGRDVNGKVVRVGGYGHVFDDLGSGYSIGHQAIQSILQAYDGRQPTTQLTKNACQHYEVPTESELIHLMTSGKLSKQQVASFAPHVFTLWHHDQVSEQIIEKTREDIIHAIRTCAEKLFLKDEAFSLVLTGGLFQYQPQFREDIRQNIQKILSHVTVHSATLHPAYGALFAACLLSNEKSVEEWQEVFIEMVGGLS